ncbi:hypothetical protein [Streptomyces vinaceus]
MSARGASDKGQGSGAGSGALYHRTKKALLRDLDAQARLRRAR